MSILSASGTQITEISSTGASFVVQLSEASSEVVRVGYAIVGGTATQGGDFGSSGSASPLTGEVVFNPGEVQQTLFFRTLSDTVVERDESVILELSAPTGADFASGETQIQAVSWIIDNDSGMGDPSPLSLFVSDIEIEEGDAGNRNASFTLELSRPAPVDLTITYSFAGSATANVDFTATAGSITIPAGGDSASIPISVRGDNAFEGLEFVDLVLGLPPEISEATGGRLTIVDDDSGEPVILADGGRFVETSSTGASFVVRLSEASSEVVTVAYSIVGGTATQSGDFGSSGSAFPLTGEVVFNPGEVQQTLFFRTLSDTVIERDESVILELSAPTGASFTGGATQLQAVSWITDNDGGIGSPSPLALFVSDIEVQEGDAGNRSASFSLELSRPAPTDVTIAYSFAGSATANVDFTATGGTITIPAGSSVTSIPITVLGDNAFEGLEFVDLVLDLPPEISESTGGRLTIIDDDNGEPVVLAEGSRFVETSSTSASFVVRLSEASDEVVTVGYSIVGGTATQSGDFGSAGSSSPLTGEVVFNPGEVQQTLFFRTNSDTVVERDESVILELSTPNGASFAGGATKVQAVSWITDNDSGINDPSPLALFVSEIEVLEGDAGNLNAAFSLELSRPAPTDLTIAYSFAGSATANVDFTATAGSITIPAGSSIASIPITVRGDTAFEGLEFVDLVLDLPPEISEAAGGRLTIVDDDGGEPIVLAEGARFVETSSTTASFVVRLSEASDEVVTVGYSIVGGTASQGSDFGSSGSSFPLSGQVTFDPGEVQQTLFFRTNGDSAAERDETVILELSSPTGASFAGGATQIQAVSWIRDNDSGLGDPAPIALAITAPEIEEGDSGNRTASFSLELSRPAPETLTFNFRTEDGTATAGQDYADTTGTVTIERGQTTASVGVTIFGDETGFDEFGPQIDNGNETFDLVVSSPSPLAVGGTATATILDDDPPVIYGTFGDDTLTGTPDKDLILARAGQDLVRGLASDDRLFGGAGDDTIIGGGGSDTVNGGSGTDTASFAGASPFVASLITGLANGPSGSVDRLVDIENLTGGSRNDLFFGDNARNVLDGGGGDDTLQGNGSNDVLEGGFGADRNFGGFGNDLIIGGAGEDLNNGGSGRDAVSFAGSGARVEVSLAQGVGTAGDAFGDVFQSIEDVIGSDFNDEIVGDSANNRIEGRDGNDDIFGRTGNDFLLGDGGNDTIRGESGNDTIRGGTGTDSLLGARGDDRILGELGDDTILGIEGSDTLFGNSGDDLVIGGSGDDDARGGAGNDDVRGQGGEDSLFGESGDDTLFGNDGADELSGGGDDDILYGGNGDDELNGNAGDDDLFGGGGNDELVGGIGNDTLRAGSGVDELQGGRGNDVLLLGGLSDTVIFERRDGRDTVRNFDDGEDLFDLTDFGFANFFQVEQLAANVGNDLVIRFTANDQLIVQNFQLADFDQSDVLI